MLTWYNVSHMVQDDQKHVNCQFGHCIAHESGMQKAPINHLQVGDVFIACDGHLDSNRPRPGGPGRYMGVALSRKCECSKVTLQHIHVRWLESLETWSQSYYVIDSWIDRNAVLVCHAKDA